VLSERRVVEDYLKLHALEVIRSHKKPRPSHHCLATPDPDTNSSRTTRLKSHQTSSALRGVVSTEQEVLNGVVNQLVTERPGDPYLALAATLTEHSRSSRKILEVRMSSSSW
jgi:hypothetical protein